MGWDVNVHVNLRQLISTHTRGGGVGSGGMLTFMFQKPDDTEDDDDDDDEDHDDEDHNYVHDPYETC